MPRQMARNIDIATEVARPSQLVNGGFEIWQRGNGPFTTSGSFTADRWLIVLGGTSTISIGPANSPAPPSTAQGTSLNGNYTHNALSLIEQKIADTPFR